MTELNTTIQRLKQSLTVTSFCNNIVMAGFYGLNPMWVNKYKAKHHYLV